jgi:hypothetical protein
MAIIGTQDSFAPAGLGFETVVVAMLLSPFLDFLD